MKNFEPLRQARKEEDQVFTDEEHEAISRLFTHWFDEYMRLRNEAEEEYRKAKGLKKPTLEQLNDVLKHRARPSDFPKVCFFYPQDIYGKRHNKYLEDIRTLFGDGEAHEEEGLGEEFDIRHAEDAPDWDLVQTQRSKRPRKTLARFSPSGGREPGEASIEGGDHVPVVRKHRRNTKVRQVDKQIHFRLNQP